MLKFQVNTILESNIPILIRILQPEDKELIKEGFSKLSARTRFLRYHSASIKLTNQDLDRLTQNNQKNCLAIGACDLTTQTPRGMGVARYISYEESPDKAELAVVVVDEYQGKGLGSLLLDLLIALARQNGINILYAHVMPENSTMIKMLRKYNAQFIYLGDILIRADISLNGAAYKKKVVGL